MPGDRDTINCEMLGPPELLVHYEMPGICTGGGCSRPDLTRTLAVHESVPYYCNSIFLSLSN